MKPQKKAAYSINSPAKINLNIQILGKREDGFHSVKTQMLPLPLTDTVTFTPSTRLQLHCDYPEVPLDESNLILQAVRLLETKTNRSFFYNIHLEKNIPHGAGLAGGSSNAASTLLALNKLENLNLSRETLANLAAKIGSDVSFFLYETLCECTGRGEIVKPLEKKFNAPLLLVKPNFGVSTPSAYKAWSESKKINDINYSEQICQGFSLINDLEKPVFAKHRFLAELKMWLLQRTEVDAALMSGSGSTIFAILNQTPKNLITELQNNLDPTLWIWSSFDE